VAKLTSKEVTAYIAAQPAAAAGALRRVRSAIRKALPAADEVISYRIPTYKVDGQTVLHFAVWTRHYSLYPASARVVAEIEGAAAPFEIKASTIRFPLAEPVPVKLIARIAKLRAKEVIAHAKAKKKRSRAAR
jgi:uncharacterized protein YdhG (YjbR/CyaY superfamily)